MSPPEPDLGEGPDAPGGDADDERDGADPGRGGVWREGEQRAKERGSQQHHRLGSAPRGLARLDDAREVDREGDEDQARERTGRAGCGDEEIIPAGYHEKVDGRE